MYADNWNGPLNPPQDIATKNSSYLSSFFFSSFISSFKKKGFLKVIFTYYVNKL